MNKDYKCTICGRLFIKPLPHKCIGNFRKHHLRKIFINTKENKDMTREQLIKQAAEEFADHEHSTMRKVSVFNLLQYAFKCGAEWADANPIIHRRPAIK